MLAVALLAAASPAGAQAPEGWVGTIEGTRDFHTVTDYQELASTTHVLDGVVNSRNGLGVFQAARVSGHYSTRYADECTATGDVTDLYLENNTFIGGSFDPAAEPIERFNIDTTPPPVNEIGDCSLAGNHEADVPLVATYLPGQTCTIEHATSERLKGRCEYHEGGDEYTLDRTVKWDLSIGGTTLEVRKVLKPAFDSGRFDLLIDGTTRRARVGDGGTTGPIQVAAGSHAVAEESAVGADGKATNLGRYHSEISCEDRTSDEDLGSVNGPGPASVEVEAGHTVVCTITNEPPLDALLLTGAYMYSGAATGPVASVAGGDGVAVSGPPSAVSHVTQVCTASTWTAKVTYLIASTLRIMWNGEVMPFIDGSVTGTETKTRRNFFTNVGTQTVTYKACAPPERAIFGPWPGQNVLLAESLQPIVKFSHGLTVEAHLDDGRVLSLKIPGKSIKGGAIKWFAQKNKIFLLQ